jgi:hypothetical protein
MRKRMDDVIRKKYDLHNGYVLIIVEGFRGKRGNLWSPTAAIMKKGELLWVGDIGKLKGSVGTDTLAN